MRGWTLPAHVAKYYSVCDVCFRNRKEHVGELCCSSVHAHVQVSSLSPFRICRTSQRARFALQLADVRVVMKMLQKADAKTTEASLIRGDKLVVFVLVMSQTTQRPLRRCVQTCAKSVKDNHTVVRLRLKLVSTGTPREV